MRVKVMKENDMLPVGTICELESIDIHTQLYTVKYTCDLIGSFEVDLPIHFFEIVRAY